MNKLLLAIAATFTLATMLAFGTAASAGGWGHGADFDGGSVVDGQMEFGSVGEFKNGGISAGFTMGEMESFAGSSASAGHGGGQSDSWGGGSAGAVHGGFAENWGGGNATGQSGTFGDFEFDGWSNFSD